jgi:hypothetical protein
VQLVIVSITTTVLLVIALIYLIAALIGFAHGITRLLAAMIELVNTIIQALFNQ